MTPNPKTEAAPGSARAWLLAARPATLTAAFVPVAVGTACAVAAGSPRWDTAAAALLGAFGIQIGTNFANDVFDAEKGADTEERLGPTRAVQAGLLDARAMRRGMAVAFLFSTLCGIHLTLAAGWPIVAIGTASIVSGIAYTGGPFPLGYNGLGDVFVLGFFGSSRSAAPASSRRTTCPRSPSGRACPWARSPPPSSSSTTSAIDTPT